MVEQPILCIKIGGRALEQPEQVAQLSEEIADLQSRYRCVIIHGGGAEVTRISKHFGLTPQFRDGIRLTTPEEMQIVDMVLAGSMNTSLVRSIGAKAVGLSGCDAGLFVGTRIAEDSHTGKIVKTNTGILESLTAQGWIPVVSSVSTDEAGTPLNINADDAALAIAQDIGAHVLVFISDIPGILENEAVIPLMTAAQAEEAIERGVITGGMIPKVRASADALESGVGAVSIGAFATKGDIEALVNGKSGTKITTQENT